ncbi:fumarylacetoacetate hydrolase family protein [Alphaproteobacteria bacterium]|nr:fumarylacetoacetate hydrolase family protein [Alphaproteobacteria bacterium]
MNTFDHFISYNTRIGPSNFLNHMKVSGISRKILDLYENKNVLTKIPPELKVRGIEEAYAVQNNLYSMLTSKGYGEIKGWKAALTSKTMQNLIGCTQPCFAGIFSKNIYKSNSKIFEKNYVNLGVETEIAIKIKNDIPLQSKPHTMDSVLKSISSFMPALEIIDDRKVDYTSLDLPTLIALNTFNSGIVIGRESIIKDFNNLKDIYFKLIVNSEIVDKGNSKDVLGGPINSLVWLANELNKKGYYIKAGDIIMTGSPIKSFFIKKGDKVKSVIDRLGSVNLNII